MCTASWLTAGDQFHLLFNRDERRTRAAGLPPREHSHEGVAYLAPIDPDSGGTWFAATERGLILALLNRSVDGQKSAPGRRSRGSLIPALVGARDLAEVGALLASQALVECAPFRLFASLPGVPHLGAVWDGRELATQPITTRSGLLCSSSRGDHEVTRVRSEQWSARQRQIAEDGLTELRRFHRSHLPTRSAVSVCMHRDDAATVSHLEVVRSPEAVEIEYFSGSPCATGDSVHSRCALRRVSPPVAAPGTC
ncbi:MAG: NRDE family protein [Thermoanaerobaculia bacterium]